jgi:hypothetical protein
LLHLLFQFLATNVGDPHIDTIDSGRYTCHIQGTYILAQTSVNANRTAYLNMDATASAMDLIYPTDLFAVYVQCELLPPALLFVEREHGFGSVFTSYMISTHAFNFTIGNNQGKFSENRLHQSS